MMELGEVVNPHYAFPVVGVILCVLLVFAFGFKSPVQPPSFDSLEAEKKPIPKKRTKTSKSKDSNKVKSQQNGRVGGSPSSKQIESKDVQQNISNIKSAEKQTPKSESKNKKTRVSSNTHRQKLDIEINKIFPEDNAEDGWVQQLSKKERKHRRKEEVANACVSNEIDKSSENETWDEQQPVAELSSCSQESTPSKDLLKQPSKKTQSLPQGIEGQKSSKKKSKKDINANQNEINMSEYHEPPAENKKSEIKLDLEQYDKPNSSIQINPEVEDESLITDDKPSKKKKGKKKNQDVNVLVTKPTQSEEIQEIKESSKTQNDNLSDTLLIDSAEVENSTIDDASKYNNENGTTESGSNVIFDELGDIWQNAKSQKKKKKARREQ
ncbi:transcriptional regulator ATRX homolog [Centruroides vittatus]|uniref:transcriptional regulator ATRX homolog n=1 Tax=Centruroides vittatus TaxID=120091 RepID=UPI00350FCA8E